MTKERDTSDPIVRAIMSLLPEEDGDPETFATFMAAWNTLCDVDQRSAAIDFQNVERAASATDTADTASDSTGTIRGKVAEMLDHFEHPAFLANASGRISVQNEAALGRFEISVGDSLERLPMDFENDKSLAHIISSFLHQEADPTDARLLRGYGPDGDVVATLAVTPASFQTAGERQVLVFVISATWAILAPDFLKYQYDLTNAEVALLTHFLQGQNIEDMALTRKRSVATVRTQFYNLMAKMQVATQTDLLRLTLSVVQFAHKVDNIAKHARHPHRKRVDMVRPGGRSVQVTLAGDLTGKPLILMPSCLTHTFPPYIEDGFRRAGYCAVTMCKPGTGDSDPPLGGAANLETFASDLRALLDQMGAPNCILFGSNMTPPTLYKLAPLLADRVTSVVQMSGCLPPEYVKKNKSSSSWVYGAIQAAFQQPSLKAFIVRSGIRAWKSMGQARFLKMQFSKHPEELARVLQPDLLEETQLALETATNQGFELATQEMIAAFSDFSADIAACPVPILILHGDQNLVYPISAVRALALDFPTNTTLIEVTGAGFALIATHLDQVLRHIETFDTPALEATGTG